MYIIQDFCHGGGGLACYQAFLKCCFLTIQNHSWTTKTCFAFVLDCLWFISSILDDLESYYMYVCMYVYVSSQLKNVQLILQKT